MEDIDKSVMELLVQKQPIGIWPLVGYMTAKQLRMK